MHEIDKQQWNKTQVEILNLFLQNEERNIHNIQHYNVAVIKWVWKPAFILCMGRIVKEDGDFADFGLDAFDWSDKDLSYWDAFIGRSGYISFHKFILGIMENDLKKITWSITYDDRHCDLVLHIPHINL